MAIAVLEKKGSCRVVQQTSNHGICPACLKERMRDTYEVCLDCQETYWKWVDQIQNGEGGIVLDPEMWTYGRCLANIRNLRDELSRAEQESKELFDRAKEKVSSRLARERIRGLDRQTRREMIFAAFDNLFDNGKNGRRRKLYFIMRRYPSIIASLEALKSRMELRMR